MEAALAGMDEEFEEQTPIDIKAGLMKLVEGKLVPDKRKGTLRVSAALVPDGTQVIGWHLRTDSGVTPEPEEEFLGMPLLFTAEFDQIGNPKSRCYVYRENNEDRIFVWLQEPNPEEDGPKVEAIRQAIKNGIENHQGSHRFGPGSEADITESAPISIAPATEQDSGSELIGAGQLASILGNILQDTSQSSAPTEGMQQFMRGMAKAPGPSLGEVLSPEVMLSLLHGDDLLQRLGEFLPEEHRNFQGLMDMAHSPQFHQQIETFSHALQTGQLDLAQFGLDAQGFSVADFLESIQKDVEKEMKQEQ
mmetsp:Transcript_36489/g.65263  ORF Transcript_36489/g.65263 Transcript_36489/m.65263 type:complete len:306 (-) Transcript_36489:360-1277(-)